MYLKSLEMQGFKSFPDKTKLVFENEVEVKMLGEEASADGSSQGVTVIVGPNGSGKTTLIKIINGLLTPSEGEITIAGEALGVESKKVVAYLPDNSYLNSWMTIRQIIDYFTDFYEDFRPELALSMLERLDPSSSGMRAQTLAVNFDTLFFAMSVNGNASVARLERMLALAGQSGCRSRVVVLLTKCDIAEGAVPLEEFLAFGVPAIGISSHTGLGLDAVREYVRPRKTVAVVGSSGVGKSSLVNALAGEDWMATGEIQEWSGKGRHTTTSRELVMLPCGAMALDTPGLRELGIFGTDGFELKGRLGGTHRFRAKG